METQEKSITTRQLVLLFYIINMCAKVMTVPILLLKIGGRCAPISLLIFLIADFLMLIAYLVTVNAEPEKTFFEFLEFKFGKIVSKIILTVLLIYTLSKLWLLISFMENFLTTSLFDGTTWQILSIPLMLLLIAFGTRNLRSLGRTAEIFSWFIILAVLVLIVLINNFEIMRLFPIGGDKDASVFLPTLMMPLWFGDYLLMFLFMGKTKKTKHFNGVLIGSGVAVVILNFVVLCLIFTSYIDIVHYLDYGKKISALTQISISRLSFGRFDILLFCVALISIILNLGLYFYGGVRMGERLFGKKEPKNINSFIAGGVLYFLFLTVFSKELVSFEIFTRYLNYFSWAVHIILPLTLMTAALIKGGKRNGRTKNVQAVENTGV